jgi:2,3-bisphosphoglycerate-dependent phosphoglycerate mutase
MKRLVIVRHGQTEWTNRFTGWTDIDLAPAGVELAKKYALVLKEKDYAFDVGFASWLKRGIRTLEIFLQTLEQTNIPVVKDWRLNERHYGALQGLNKPETAQKYGMEQVNLWRRSYDTPPPALESKDPRHPANDPRYKDVDPTLLPSSESLKNTYERVIPYFKEKIEVEIAAGKTVLLSGHSNSIRAIVKYLDNLSEEEIVSVNIPYCIPQVYEFDDDLRTTKHYYLATDDEVEAAIQSVKNQIKK